MSGTRRDVDGARPQIDLREACAAEALRIIKDVGIEELSLREVARRLNVSHQAPYRHFPSRDHLLAEVVDRCFKDFNAHLTAAGESGDPRADFAEMGRLYLEYARTHPLEYRLMFGARLPDPQEHPAMMEKGHGAFDQLRSCIARIVGAPVEAPAVTFEAMFVWSTVHGLASIVETEAMGGLGIDGEAQQAVVAHVLARLQSAVEPR